MDPNTEYKIQNTKYTLLFTFLAFVAPLLLYLKTLAPTYIPIDSAEFALCMKFWGICHPPGFPLYILLGKIFTQVWPLGTLIYKANLLSAIFGTLTVFFVYLTLVELKVARSIAFLTAGFLAVNQILWEFSAAADVFAFAAFLITLTFFFAFKNRKFAAFFVLGLSCSHFYISAVLWPILAWYFLNETGNWKPASPAKRGEQETGNRKKSLLFIVYCLLFFAIGFFPQVLMYWRMQQTPEINWGHAQGIGGFIDYVRRKEFGSIFLIANPVLTFTLLKVFKQFWAYFASFLANFAVILPIVTIGIVIFGRLFTNRRVILLVSSYIVFVTVQLILLSTIDPLEKSSPFQLNKFYLSSFVIFIFLLGICLDFVTRKFFEGNGQYILIILGFLIVIYFLTNLKINNYSNNYFSQNMVFDALSQLPEGSIAVTVSHIAYFGGLYEQKINNRFESIKLIYIPNDKNRDSQEYRPEVFEKEADSAFIEKVKSKYNLGSSEGYVLETLARNLDKPVFILQGSFEEKFFAFLKPYLLPWGLWWKIEPSEVKLSSDVVSNKFSSLANSGLRDSDLALKQQRDDILTYAVAYHSAGIYLASRGEYEQALGFLRRSLGVNSQAQNINDEINLIDKVAKLDGGFNKLLTSGDRSGLLDLGNGLFTLQNFDRCTQVYGKAVSVFGNDANFFNNLGSCLASSGNVSGAADAYRKALEIDPNLDLAKKGLEALGK